MSIKNRIKADRKEGESYSAQARRIGIPLPTLRKAERLDVCPSGSAGVLLRRHLGLRDGER